MVITEMRNEEWLEVAYRISQGKNGLNLALSIELTK